MWHRHGQGDHCDGMSCQMSLVAVISNQYLAKCGSGRDREITVMDCLVKTSMEVVIGSSDKQPASS